MKVYEPNTLVEKSTSLRHDRPQPIHPVDLAGLVTPEIIPSMKDQHKLANFVRKREVTHLVVFSSYYRDMLTELNAELVFSPNRDKLKDLHLEPFEVYEVPLS